MPSLSALIDPFGILRGVAALPRLADALQSLSRLATPEVVRELEHVRRDLASLAEAADSLRELAATRATLEELAATREVLGQLAGAAVHLERLAGTDASLQRLADAAHALETLAHNSTVLPALAAATRNLPKVPAQVESLDRTMLTLDQSIAILAEAIAPLQGTTARIGRMVDRLPDRARRRELEE